MSIFQEEYETAKSLTEIPAVFLRGIEHSNDYDWGRGRITNYIAFGIEAFVRNSLPFPFISWLTMAVALLNSALLAHVITKPVENLSQRVSLFCLTTLLIVLNPLFQYSYQLQFIYPKYLFATFLLLFLISRKLPFKLFFLSCAIFSDEIGLVAAMLVTFIKTLEYCCKVRGITQMGESFLTSRTTVNLLKPLLCGLAASLMLLFLYCLTLVTILGTYGILTMGGNSIIRLTNISVIYASTKYIFETANAVLGSNFIATIMVLLLCLYILLKNIRKTKIGSSFLDKRGWNLVISNIVSTPLNHYLYATFLMLFIVFVMYGGAPSGFPLFAHYAYPVAMLLAFLLISLLIRSLPYRHAAGLLIALVFLAIINVPNTIKSLEFIPDVVIGMRSPSISQKDLNRVEIAIKEFRREGRSAVFDEINNHQELNFSGGYLYSKDYLPVSGMVRVLIWPKKLPGERTHYKHMNTNVIKHWRQIPEKIAKKFRKIFQ